MENLHLVIALSGFCGNFVMDMPPGCIMTFRILLGSCQVTENENSSTKIRFDDVASFYRRNEAERKVVLSELKTPKLKQFRHSAASNFGDLDTQC